MTLSWLVDGEPDPDCAECDGDGYIEWLTDRMECVTAPCPKCYPFGTDGDTW